MSERHELQLDEHDERVLELVAVLGWHDLNIAPRPPHPSWQPDKSELSTFDRKLLGDVETYGWHCLHVHPYAQREPKWSFTVGLPATRGHPELLVFGLPDDVGHAVMSTAVAAIESGQRYDVVGVYDDLLEERPARFVRVRPHWYASFLGYAQWFHECDRCFEVLQLVWPDHEGHWPWERSCALPRGVQPVLGAP